MDVTDINDGRWRIVCLFGGYAQPDREVRNLGAGIAPADIERWDTNRALGMRVSAVEDFEAALAYIGDDDMARFIHLPHGLGPSGQDVKSCVTTPATSLLIREKSDIIGTSIR